MREGDDINIYMLKMPVETLSGNPEREQPVLFYKD